MKQVFFFRQGGDNKRFIATWVKVMYEGGAPRVLKTAGYFQTRIYSMGNSEVSLLSDIANKVPYSITLDYPETRGSLWRELNEQGYLQVGTTKLRQFYPTQRWMVEDAWAALRTFDTMEKAFGAFCEYLEVLK